MEYFSRKKVIGWIVAVLIVINIGAISVFAYHICCNPGSGFDNRSPQGPGPDSFLVKELGLDAAQEAQFTALKKSHMEKVHAVANQIRIMKKDLADGVVAEKADTLKLDSIADEIGVLYASIRKANTRHYLELKKICNPEQQKKLAEIFGNVFCCDEKQGCKGNGKGHHGCDMDKPDGRCKDPNKYNY